MGNMAEPYEDVPTPAGRFFAQRVSWASNIAWVSVDDAASFSRFEELFQRLRLPERFVRAQESRPKVTDISGGRCIVRTAEKPDVLLQRTIDAIDGATFTGKVRACLYMPVAPCLSV